MPRWAWWTIAVLSALDLGVNLWAYESYRPGFHPTATIVAALTCLLATNRLRFKDT